MSLADFFDVERNPATILSRGTVDPLGSEHLVFFDNSAASGLLGMTSGASSGSTSGSSRKRAPVFVESTNFDNSAASGLTGMLSGSVSGPSVLSFGEEIMLDQQLTKAFQTGLRHSLDDPDHDAMSDL